MTQLTLDETEATLLRELLDEHWRDLRVQITSTETPPFKDELKERQAVLLGIINQLNAMKAG